LFIPELHSFPTRRSSDLVKDEGINLEVVAFTDYSQPNRALADGDIDLNAFQHHIFLENFNEEFGADLEPIANTIIEPLGIYSDEDRKSTRLNSSHVSISY